MPEARIGSGLWRPRPAGRYRSRFFELVGRETTYHKVASSNTSRLEAHAGFFRLLMKWIFDPYVL